MKFFNSSLKQFSNDNKYIILLISSTFISYSICNLFYLSTRSPDYERYSKYFSYFNGDIETTNLEQGLLYYFIAYCFVVSFLNGKLALPENSFYFNFDNFDHLTSLGIQTANHLIFFIGLIGLFYFFKELNYNPKIIWIVISILNLTPDAIKLKLTLKPEILGFSLLCWVFYFLEKYKNTKLKQYLYIAIFISAIISTLKASIFAMSFLVLIYLYLDIIKKLSFKELFLIGIVFLLVFVPLYFENYEANKRSIFSRNDLLTEYDQGNYDNKADLSFLLSFNLLNYFQNPLRDSQANSAFGITTSDMFGDYFNLYWNLDYSLFKQDVKHFLQASDSNKIDFENRVLFIKSNININFVYLKQYISFLLSVIFIIYLLTNFYLSKNIFKKLNLLPFIGIFVLLLNAFGLPENNFDPEVGDTLKPFYYSYLTLITLSYIFIELLKKRKKSTYMFIFTLLIMILFMLGFPKENNSKLDYDLIEHNKKTIFCELNSIYLNISLIEKEGINCLTREQLLCLDLNYIKEIPPVNFYFNNDVLTINNLNKCIDAVNKGYIFKDENYKFNKLPSLSLFIVSTLIMLIVSNFYWLRKTERK